MENKYTDCNHWREYDDDKGMYEYCKLKRKSCACCGTEEQCTYPYELNKEKNNA